PRDWARGGDTLEAHGRRPKIAERASGRNGRRHVPTKGERILMNRSRMGFTWWRIGPAIALFCAGLSPVAARATEPPKEPQGPLRIIVFGAHPDDCELEAGGTAALWSKQGYKVKFVSVTNGDIGHYQMAGAILARRRTAEVKRCAQILGIETEVL